MLSLHQISKFYNLQPVLHEVTFTVNAGERLALVGPNGSGKSTLMRIIAGQEMPDSGIVLKAPPDLRIGYLSQGFELDDALTMGELLGRYGGDPAVLEADLARLAAELMIEPASASLQEAYDDVLQRLGQVDAGLAQTLLAQFDLDHVPPDQPVGFLSGGQKTRLSLVLVLLNEPQLLLLDEPTNHLDIAMLEWLEAWLRSFAGGVLMVSHDRVFLDRTATTILDLDPLTHEVTAYTGNFSAYVEAIQLEHDRHDKQWRDQEYEVRRMRQDIARTKEQAASVERSTSPNQPGVRRIAKKVARKARSREKKLDRYLAADDRVEKPALSWQLKMEFDDAAHVGRDVLVLEAAAVGYAPHAPLLSGLSLSIQSGERVILTGPNGLGKTTLLRSIAGELPLLSGRMRLGGSVRLGYMSQEQELLDPAKSALEMIQLAAPLNETEARSFLHYYLFTGDDAVRPIGDLSYGERARLALARLVAEGCTFMLLDEPINHLDIPSRTRFEQALHQFPGAILAVVHDRYFIEGLATTVWEAENGVIVPRLA